MQSVYLSYQSHSVHFLKFGSGERLLFALHGFGDRARMFAVLEPVLAKKYTVYALDLPFHGQTEWLSDTFSKPDLLAIIGQVMEIEGKKRLSIMAFSFGARLAQAMLPELIGRLDKLYLLSPDGINTKGMSAAVHTPIWARHLTRKALKNPDWFLRLVRLGTRLHVVPGLIVHFLTSNLTRPDRFQRSFGCWLSLESFYLRRRRIRAILHESNLPTDVFFGEKDEMIRFKTLKKMSDSLPKMRLFLLDEGHRVVGEQLRDLLLSEP